MKYDYPLDAEIEQIVALSRKKTSAYFQKLIQ